jgi:transposase
MLLVPREVARKLLSETQGQDFNREQMEVDAVRLYEQGWSIRRVAKEFGVSYGVVRRILMRKTMLRDRKGTQS